MSDQLLDELSPDGRTLVHWAVSDGRMSHIIRTPTIVDAGSGETILALSDSGFDGSIVWGRDGGFDVDLRHYWRPGTLCLTVDRTRATFHVTGAEDEHPLGEIGDFVEARFKAAEREAAKAPAGRSGEARRMRSEWPLWLLAIGICVAIWVLFFRR